jgi:hypothetical protein
MLYAAPLELHVSLAQAAARGASLAAIRACGGNFLDMAIGPNMHASGIPLSSKSSILVSCKRFSSPLEQSQAVLVI